MSTTAPEGRGSTTAGLKVVGVAIRREPWIFTLSTLGSVLERLEAKGWVLRGGSPADRRIKLLRVTLEGERLLRQVEPSVQRVQQRLLEHLTPADRASFLRLLTQLASIHNELTPAPLRTAGQG